MKWSEVEEKILSHKYKIYWLQLGDGNNEYFNTSVGEKNKGSSIYKLIKEKGETITMQEELEREVLNFCRDLLGQSARTLRDIDALRKGKLLSASQCRNLIRPIQYEVMRRSLML